MLVVPPPVLDIDKEEKHVKVFLIYLYSTLCPRLDPKVASRKTQKAQSKVCPKYAVLQKEHEVPVLEEE